MFDAETALLKAVRNRLRDQLNLTTDECTVEIDDQVPAIARDTYYVVTPGGSRPGPRQATATAGTIDMIVSVRVVAYKKIGNTARDRRRDIFLEQVTGLNALLSAASEQIDQNETLRAAANTLLDDEAVGGAFITPLQYAGYDPKPQSVFAQEYAAAVKTQGDPQIALKRGILFGNARFLQVRA